MIYTYRQLSQIQMSFFERMMRITQPQNHHKEVLQGSFDEEEEEEVPDEPRVETVYASAKPILLGHLLPKREQLLRDMMARKRQFQMKRMANSNIVKGAQLKQRLEDSNSNFVNGIQQQNGAHIGSAENAMRLNESNKGLTTSAATNVLPNQCTNNIGKKSLKQSIVQKSLKESLVLQISASSRRKDSECSNTGPNLPMGMSTNNNGMNGGDPLSRQIMLRLLNMLQNERNDRKDLLAMSMSNHFSLPHDKQQPIVINNILKTPVEALNKDLIERQMKIRLLQDQRMRNKQAIHPIRSHHVDLVSDQPLTQRSELPHCQEFTPTEQRNSCQGNQNYQNRKGKVSLECSRISIQSIRERQIKGKEKVVSSSKEEQSTKPCSNFSSQITQTEPSHQSNQRERHFNRPNRPSNRNQARPNQAQTEKQQGTMKEEGYSPAASETIVHKASIRLDIPLNQSNQGEGLTLAEAFKKRIGKLKSEKEKTKKTAPPVTVIGDENFVKTELYPEYKTPKDACIPLFPLESTQTVNLSKKRPKSRAQHVQSQFSENGKQTASSKGKQPAKGLIDRLIGGERAKVSKKEMYALTRKNYENLPEVQAKKKEEEKKELEVRRLAKIRELQRSTRSIKGSSLQNQNMQRT